MHETVRYGRAVSDLCTDLSFVMKTFIRRHDISQASVRIFVVSLRPHCSSQKPIGCVRSQAMSICLSRSSGGRPRMLQKPKWVSADRAKLCVHFQFQREVSPLDLLQGRRRLAPRANGRESDVIKCGTFAGMFGTNPDSESEHATGAPKGTGGYIAHLSSVQYSVTCAQVLLPGSRGNLNMRTSPRK